MFFFHKNNVLCYSKCYFIFTSFNNFGNIKETFIAVVLISENLFL
jgi:hypothetical protein